ncbi:hypothetical protein O9929_27810 [Vibrio lentus]|nr:hypothetical protein [Vibrio lentus]
MGKRQDEEDTVNEPEQVTDNQEEETLINEVDDSINEAEEANQNLVKEVRLNCGKRKRAWLPSTQQW